MIFKNGQMIGWLMGPDPSRPKGKGSECTITGQTQELLGSFANLFIEYSIEFFWRVWIFSTGVR